MTLNQTEVRETVSFVDSNDARLTADLIEETLTDGSAAYNVRIAIGPESVTLDTLPKRSARALFNALRKVEKEIS